jgi:hypothetical protein
MNPPPFVCQKCGAALAFPMELHAVSARCTYCGTDTMLPPEVLAARNPPLQPMQPLQPMEMMQPIAITNTVNKGMKFVLWIVILTAVLPIVIVVIVFLFVGHMLSSIGVRHR